MTGMDIYAQSALGNTDDLPYGDDTCQIVDEAEGGVIAYCHELSADRIVAALNAYSVETTPASDLGSLIAALAGCNPDTEVFLDYDGELARPGKPTYYRGYHDELALTPDGAEPSAVAGLLDVLRDIRVNGFTRPGRETEASDSTRVWVAKHREPSGLHVTGVRRERARVIILTHAA